MSLSIGELTGFIRIDPSGVDDGVNQAENRMRQAGQTMGSDADRAGQAAGQALGGGLVRGADGSIRTSSGALVRAGQQAGDDVGEGLTDGATQGGEDAAAGAESGLSKLKMAAAGIGLAAGGALMAGLGDAMEQGQITGRLGAQMGKTPAEAQKYGKIAGAMYADAITEDFQGAADAIGATMSAGLTPPGATNAQIKSIATNVSDLANTFDLDLGQAANAVGQIMKNGLAPNAQSAMDVITRGLQVMGPRADDIADTFNEYGTIFRQMGLSAADATGIMSQGMAAGARDTDVVADSLKEFVLIAQDGGKQVEGAFKSIGLNGKEMQKVFAEGGPKSKAALDQVFDALRKVKDPAQRSSLALTLFGTKAEDMQKALFSIDPSKAAASLGKIGGAADRMGDTLRDNAGTKLEAFKRGLQQGLVNMIGTYVIPVLMKIPSVASQVGQAFATMAKFIESNKTTFIAIASIITTLMLPSLISWATTAATAAAANIAAWATSSAAAVTGAARAVAANALVIAGWIRSAATTAASAAVVVAGWVMMGVQSMIRAAQMAAAWIVAMGPVGWIIAAVVALVALIIANWDTVKSWTLAIWDWVWNKIKAIAGFLVTLFMNFTLVGLIIKHWDTIKAATQAAWDWVKNAVMTVVNWMISFVTGQFNAIKSVITTVWNAIKSVSSTVWNAIKSAVMSIINAVKTSVTSQFNAIKSVITSVWNAIKSVTSSVWNAIKSTITSLVNGAKSAVSSAINSIKSFFSSGFNAVKSTVSNAISGVVSTIKGLAGKVKGAISGAGQWLVSAGKSIIQGLINGIKNMAGNVVSAVKGVLSKARDLLPFSPAKTGPFSGKGWTLYSGRSMMTALAKGISQKKATVAQAVAANMKVAQRKANLAQYQTQKYVAQTATTDAYGNEMAGAQNGTNARALQIQNYYEAESGSARATAVELEWLAKARG